MSVATCGHIVAEGITCSVDEGEMMLSTDDTYYRVTSYGTYCAKCVLAHYVNNTLENEELKELIKLVTIKVHNKLDKK